MGLNNSIINVYHEGYCGDTESKILECITAVSPQTTFCMIIVGAEFLVLVCASNLLHLVHRLTPAVAVDMCNLGAR